MVYVRVQRRIVRSLQFYEYSHLLTQQPEFVNYLHAGIMFPKNTRIDVPYIGTGISRRSVLYVGLDLEVRLV
jgi:hypothetical protein